jgi:ABC-type antimicrobial peptide transport system permease subunit
MNIRATPPRIFMRFFRWYCHPGLADHIEGDLLEVYIIRVKRLGKKRADIHFIIDVMSLFRPGIIRSFQSNQSLTTYGMYKNYLKIGWRNVMQARFFSFVKVLGLSIGLTACMLIMLFTKDEMSYDQFHENKNQIYRVIQKWQFGNDEPRMIGVSNAVIGEAFGKEIPEVEAFVRVNGTDVTVKRGDDIFNEVPLFVDANFFSIFSFPMLEGNPATALKDLRSAVVSEEFAHKYFGTTEVIGQTLEVKVDDEFDIFTVTGVVSNSPNNSSLKPSLLLPFFYFENQFNDNKEWFGGSMNTFLLLQPGADIDRVQAKMQKLFDKNIKEKLATVLQERGVVLTITLALQRLTDIHLSTIAGPDNGMTEGSKPAYSYILSTIAGFILLIACINFINLTIAQSLKRGKEIGIRKVVGGTRHQLVRQFLIESLLVSSIAFGIAMIATTAIIPLFNGFANKSLSMSHLSDGYFYGACAFLLVMTAFTAGFYPSLVVSAFSPVKALYTKQKVMGKNYFSKSLVLVQFALSIFLITGTIVINSQMNFLSGAYLGYDSRNLVRIDIPGNASSDVLPQQFKNELAGNPKVSSVAAKHGGRSITSVKVDGKVIQIENNKIDDNFFTTFRIPIISGRNFSPAYPSDSIHSVIVNETFVKEAGWKLNEAVGRVIHFMNNDDKPPVTVVGVIRDYHFSPLKEKIGPAVFSMNPNFNFGQIWVRISAEDIRGTLSSLERSYKKLVPLFPYTYKFMDDINASNYATESKLKQIIIIASGIFILISCMGLLGLVMLSIEQRIKEIGIRKVLGAAVSRIIALISTEFAIVIGVAFIVAIPIAYFVLDTWLQEFAYRITLQWWMFALAGVLIMTLAILIVCLQALKAAFVNPVKLLRSE